MGLVNTRSKCVVCGGDIIAYSEVEGVTKHLFCKKCGLLYHHLFEDPRVTFEDIQERISSDLMERIERKIQLFEDRIDFLIREIASTMKKIMEFIER